MFTFSTSCWIYNELHCINIFGFCLHRCCKIRYFMFALYIFMLCSLFRLFLTAMFLLIYCSLVNVDFFLLRIRRCCVMWFIATQLNATDNSTVAGDNSASGNSAEPVANRVTVRYCTLGLVGQCAANEQCVARRKTTVLRSRSGLCRCLPGFIRDAQTNLCYDGRNHSVAESMFRFEKDKHYS